MGKQPRSSSGISFTVMMLVLLVVMAIGGVIAYLLVYPFFHRQHSSAVPDEKVAICLRTVTADRNYLGNYLGEDREARSAIITGILSSTG